MLIANIERGIDKINAHKWVLIEDGIRDQVWAKIKNGKVHVLSSYYDEDGFFSRKVFIGNTYKEAIESDPILSHDEDFEPIDIDGEDW